MAFGGFCGSFYLINLIHMKAKDIIPHLEAVIAKMDADCTRATSAIHASNDQRFRNRHAARRTALLDAMDVVGLVLEMCRRRKSVTAKWYNECLTKLAGRAIENDPAAGLALRKLAPDFKIRVTA